MRHLADIVSAHWLQAIADDKDMKDALRKLDKLTTVETRLTISETFSASQQILAEVQNLRSDGQVHADALERIETQVTHVNTHLSVLVDSQTRQLDADIRRWLAPPDPSENHYRILGSRYLGSGAWMMNDPIYLAWKDSEASFLWLHGKPGSGKSVLCSFIIDALMQTPSNIVAYYYFDFRDVAKQDAYGLVRSLVTQLSGASPESLRLHRTFFASCDQNGWPNLVLLTAHLRRLLAALSAPIYIVIDAADECSLDARRMDVLPCLRSLRYLGANVHVLLASRPEVDIRRSFTDMSIQEMDLQDVEPHARDMGSYIAHVLTSDLDFCDWPRHLVELTRGTLERKANGMFRWVALQLESLRRCLPKYVEKILNDLPENLSDTYIRILDRIDKKYIADVLRILSCIAFSQRPMSAAELGEIFATDFEREDGVVTFLAPLRVHDPVSKILELCSGLVVLPRNVASFAHLSVKEYLLSNQTPERYHLDPPGAHHILAQLCMACLFSSDYGGHPRMEPNLTEYASQFWMHHASYPSVAPRLNTALDMLLRPDSTVFYLWSKHYMLLNPLELPVIRNLLAHNPLVCAAYCGFTVQIANVIREDASQVSESSLLQALYAAIVSGDASVVELLLDTAPACNIDKPVLYILPKMSYRLSLFQIACRTSAYDRISEHRPRCSQLAVLRVLLEHGARVNVPPNRISGTPLHDLIAGWPLSRTRLLSFVEQDVYPALRLLLDNGAQVNAVAGELTALLCRNAFYARASAVFHENVTNALLSHPDTRSDSHLPTLHCTFPGLSAIPSIARLLLQDVVRASIMIAHPTATQTTPVHLAAQKLVYAEHFGLHTTHRSLGLQESRGLSVWVLIVHEPEACVRARNDPQVHVVCTARTINEALALMKRDDTTGRCDNLGCSVVFVAARHCPIWKPFHCRMLFRIFRWGADFNARDGDGQTALHRICTGAGVLWDTEILETLLGWGADANIADNHGQTVLHLVVMALCGLAPADNRAPRLYAAMCVLLRAGADAYKARRTRKLVPRPWPQRAFLGIEEFALEETVAIRS
ncbi:ankyrin [Peniophora sp. CONT]|nr:ankyrin [Peniophora sp. CONT]